MQHERATSLPGIAGHTGNSKPRFRRWEASEYLSTNHGIQVAPATLAKLASVGGGPRFQKVGRAPHYPKEELDAWAASKLGQLQSSTSSPTTGD